MMHQERERLEGKSVRRRSIKSLMKKRVPPAAKRMPMRLFSIKQPMAQEHMATSEAPYTAKKGICLPMGLRHFTKTSAMVPPRSRKHTGCTAETGQRFRKKEMAQMCPARKKPTPAMKLNSRKPSATV